MYRPPILVALFLAAAEIGFGCSCINLEPFCNRLPDSKEKNAAIFTGVVKEVYPAESPRDYLKIAYPDFERRNGGPELGQMKDALLRIWSGVLLPEEEQKIKDATSTHDLDMPFKGLLWNMPRRVRFAVTEKFMGVDKDTFELFTGLGGGDCGVDFRVGESYLVEAGREESTGRWSSTACSRTQNMRHAEGDLMTLRAWKKGEKLQPMVYGTIYDSTNRGDGTPIGQKAMPNLKLTMRSGDELRETSTDSQGWFKIENLSKKMYQLHADLPGWSFAVYNEVHNHLDLNRNACLDLFLSMEERQGEIHGSLVSPERKLPGVIWVEAIPINRATLKVRSGNTRKDGSFVIGALEPADYVLAIDVENPPVTENSRRSQYERITPYPPMYYPGTPQRARAAVFHIERGQILKVPAWNLPPASAERSIGGVVRWPDGTAAGKAKVRLMVTSTGKGGMPRDAGIDGSFTLFGVADLDYTVQAAAYHDGEKRTYKASVQVPAGHEPLVIVLQPDGTSSASDAH